MRCLVCAKRKVRCILFKMTASGGGNACLFGLSVQWKQRGGFCCTAGFFVAHIPQWLMCTNLCFDTFCPQFRKKFFSPRTVLFSTFPNLQAFICFPSSNIFFCFSEQFVWNSSNIELLSVLMEKFDQFLCEKFIPIWFFFSFLFFFLLLSCNVIIQMQIYRTALRLVQKTFNNFCAKNKSAFGFLCFYFIFVEGYFYIFI